MVLTVLPFGEKKGGAGAMGRGTAIAVTVCTNELLGMRKMGMPLRLWGSYVPLVDLQELMIN